MPSLFARARRASESSMTSPSTDDHGLRKSMDNGPPSSFTTPTSKLKSLLGKKSSSHHLPYDAPNPPSSPNSPAQTPTRANGIENRRSPNSPLARLPSPTTASHNRRSSLSTTLSPEGDPDARRDSVSWQPSYPTVVPDDLYADIAPDGHTVPNGNPSPRSPILPNENAHRRSLDGRALQPANEDFNVMGWPALIPASNHSKVNGLPTPPPTAPSASPTTESTSRDTSAPPDNAPSSSTTSPGNTAKSPRPRPDMPVRKPTLISSPPMPQPIKNLPTLVGLLEQQDVVSTPTKEGGPRTPGWTGGNVPRTPGWGGLMSPRIPSTPGGMGFPWTLPSTTVQTNKKDKEMSDDEVRRARRAMPSLLREPSVAAIHDQNDGEVDGGDDTSGEDSETEIGEHQHDDDSEDETETDRVQETSPATSLRNRLKGKGKGKAKAREGVSSLAQSVVREEDSQPTSSQSSIPDSGSAPRSPGSPSHRPNLHIDTKKPEPSTTQSWGKWSLPTPGSKRSGTGAPEKTNDSWTMFSVATPAAPTPAISSTYPHGGMNVPSGTGSSRDEGEGYFSSHPGSSAQTSAGVSPEIPSTTASLDGHQKGKTTAAASLGAIVSDTVPAEPKAMAQDSASTVPETETPTLTRPAEDANKVVLQDGTAEHTIASETGASNTIVEDTAGDDGRGSSEGSIESTERSPAASPEPVVVAPSTPERPAASTGAISPPSTGTSRHLSPSRPSFYSRPSRSMVDLSTPPTASQSTATLGTTYASGNAILPTRSRERPPTKISIPTRLMRPEAILTPNSEWKRPPPTPAAGFAGYPASRSRVALGETAGPSTPLPRRRSADDLAIPPPGYEPPLPGTYIPRPRDEEGRETLPDYWCAVHIEGQLQRKLEFSAPGVQSRDRSWKKLYFIVRGTSLLVYKFDPHRFPLKIESGPPIQTVTEEESQEHLHVHTIGEVKTPIALNNPSSGASAVAAAQAARIRAQSSASSTNPSSGPSSNASASSSSLDPRRASTSSATSATSSNTSQEKEPNLFPDARKRSASVTSTASSSAGGAPIASHFQQNQLIKQYTLQNSESGLAADYLKRRNVVRVRAEGEQFLLQTESARDVVDWIEALQAATNVALDLDERPMPKIITLPRRRRRRVVGAGAAAAGTSGTSGANASGTNSAAAGAASGPDTAAANVAAVSAAEAASRGGNGNSGGGGSNAMERMLAEDQAAAAAA